MEEYSVSDHIGRIGESWFDLFVNRAKLLSGKIDPDRIGRDRVLEFPAEIRNEKEPFDVRPAPLGCSIQIKSILSTNDRVTLALSVAERLAGDNRPTFICVLRIAEEDEVVEMYLVHLLDEILERILERLRKEFALGTKALHKKYITFSVSSGRKVDLTPSHFKSALIDMIGEDMNSYAETKMLQRKTVGFIENDRYSMNVTFEETSHSDLIDGFLGIKELEVKNLEAFEQRFNIKLPGGFPVPENADKFVIKFDPSPVSAGKIIVSSPASEKPIEIFCDYISPAIPKLPVEKLKVIARSKLVDALISMEDGNIKLKSTFEPISVHPVMDWWAFFNLWSAFYNKGGHIQFQTASGKKLFAASISESDLPKERPKHIDRMLEAIEMTRELLEEADSLDKPFSLSDVMQSAEAIKQTHQFFFHWQKLGEFSFQVERFEELGFNESSGLFVSTFNLGENIYAYALKLDLEISQDEEGTKFRSKGMSPLRISWIENDDAALKKFAVQTAKFSGTGIMIMRTNIAMDQNTNP